MTTRHLGLLDSARAEFDGVVALRRTIHRHPELGNHLPRTRAAVSGAEDFSYVLQRYGGAFAFIGVCPSEIDSDCAPACHSNLMQIDEAAMVTGIAMHASIVLDYLDPIGTEHGR
ncbi:MAG: hypothetical protein HOI95_05415 [Chromatiales bacterium]|jgi:metal-dependent amidase/aminoacylase/carboxypeptidase family protein|nr:hypothetical protein [Chromatiales bacterium]